jgi:very-short-patch-repair endonuclease
VSNPEKGQNDTTKKTNKVSKKKEWKDINGQKIWERICPKCNNIIIHKNRHSWWSSRKYNKLCYSCKNSGENNPFYNKRHSESHKLKLKISQNKLPHVYKSQKFSGIDQRIELQCLGCDVIFKSRLTKQKRYCTIKCFNRSQAKRGIYTSLPERQFAQILINKNIKFEHQYELCGKIFDFYIPDKNILIEIDGVYWHNKNNRYASNLHSKIKRNDMLKNSIAEQNRVTLIRLWEDELEDVSKYLY